MPWRDRTGQRAGGGDLAHPAAQLHRLRQDVEDYRRHAFKAIKDGGASVGLSAEMPSWSKGLDDDEIHGLVAYVRSFCKQ
jgi:mono/diheme cytochrome c family protein